MRFNKKTGKKGVIKRMATFVEYAMLVGLLALAVAVAVAYLSGKLGEKVKEEAGAIDDLEVVTPQTPKF